MPLQTFNQTYLLIKNSIWTVKVAHSSCKHVYKLLFLCFLYFIHFHLTFFPLHFSHVISPKFFLPPSCSPLSLLPAFLFFLSLDFALPFLPPLSFLLFFILSFLSCFHHGRLKKRVSYWRSLHMELFSSPAKSLPCCQECKVLSLLPRRQTAL